MFFLSLSSQCECALAQKFPADVQSMETKIRCRRIVGACGCAQKQDIKNEEQHINNLQLNFSFHYCYFMTVFIECLHKSLFTKLFTCSTEIYHAANYFQCVCAQCACVWWCNLTIAIGRWETKRQSHCIHSFIQSFIYLFSFKSRFCVCVGCMLYAILCFVCLCESLHTHTHAHIGEMREWQ